MNPTPKITFRQADIGDLDDVVAIGRETFMVTYSGKNTVEEITRHLDVSFHPDRIKAEILNPESTWFFAELESEIAGFIKLNIGKAQTNNPEDNNLEVEKIYLRKNFQGKGLGRAMMDMAVERARAQKVDSVWLGVWEKNPEAIAFYKHYGFRQDGFHPFIFDGELVNDLLMRLDLES
ncbi:MAG: GNAT family N-acetyltransferase [Bacteroidota bacterium]